MGHKAFDQLLGNDMTAATFFNEYWEKKPLIIRRNDSNFYSNCFDRDQMMDILTTSDRNVDNSAVPLLRFAKDLRVCRYIAGKRIDAFENGSVATSEQLTSAFAEGYTTQFFQPQRYSNKLWEIIADMEASFGTLVGSSAYLTPPGSQGLYVFFSFQFFT